MKSHPILYMHVIVLNVSDSSMFNFFLFIKMSYSNLSVKRHTSLCYHMPGFANHLVCLSWPFLTINRKLSIRSASIQLTTDELKSLLFIFSFSIICFTWMLCHNIEKKSVATSVIL